MKILHGSCREYPTKKTWKVDYDFLIAQMKNPQVDLVNGKDEVLAKKFDRKLREGQRQIDTLRTKELDSTLRFKQVTGTEIDEDLGNIDTTNVNT